MTERTVTVYFHAGRDEAAPVVAKRRARAERAKKKLVRGINGMLSKMRDFRDVVVQGAVQERTFVEEPDRLRVQIDLNAFNVVPATATASPRASQTAPAKRVLEPALG